MEASLLKNAYNHPTTGYFNPFEASAPPPFNPENLEESETESLESEYEYESDESDESDEVNQTNKANNDLARHSSEVTVSVETTNYDNKEDSVGYQPNPPTQLTPPPKTSPNEFFRRQDVGFYPKLEPFPQETMISFGFEEEFQSRPEVKSVVTEGKKSQATKTVSLDVDPSLRKLIIADVQGAYNQAIKKQNYEQWLAIVSQAKELNIKLTKSKIGVRRLLNKKLLQILVSKAYHELNPFILFANSQSVGKLKLSDGSVLAGISDNVFQNLLKEIILTDDAKKQLFAILCKNDQIETIKSLYLSYSFRGIIELLSYAAVWGKTKVLIEMMNLVQATIFDYSYLIIYLIMNYEVSTEVYAELMKYCSINYIYLGFGQENETNDVEIGTIRKIVPYNKDIELLSKEQYQEIVGMSFYNICFFNHNSLCMFFLKNKSFDINFINNVCPKHILLMLLEYRDITMFEETITNREDIFVSWNNNALLKYAGKQANRKAINLIKSHPNFISPDEMGEICNASTTATEPLLAPRKMVKVLKPKKCVKN